MVIKQTATLQMVAVQNYRDSKKIIMYSHFLTDKLYGKLRICEIANLDVLL